MSDGRPSSQAGFTIVEVLVAALVAGVAIVGIALMFGSGSAWVSVLGEDRVALGLAEQRIEVLRDEGWRDGAAWVRENGSVIVRVGNPNDPRAKAFRMTTCAQYVDPATPAGLGVPAYAPECAIGAATGPVHTVRITVTVEQADQPQATPVVLQAWLTELGR